jgi:RNA polymerase sigma-70 factor, ECF subfamily
VGSAGEHAAEIGRLYDEYGSALLLFATTLTGNRSMAQDAVHQVFLKLMEAGSIHAVSDKRAFLFTSVRNLVYNESKRWRRSLPLENDAPWFEPPLHDYAGEKLLRLALSGLPENQREVVVLHLWGEFTFTDIGGILGISENTAASRYRYALTKLRRSILREESSRV